eukprot:gene20328-7345_t
MMIRSLREIHPVTSEVITHTLEYTNMGNAHPKNVMLCGLCVVEPYIYATDLYYGLFFKIDLVHEPKNQAVAVHTDIFPPIEDVQIQKRLQQTLVYNHAYDLFGSLCGSRIGGPVKGEPYAFGLWGICNLGRVLFVTDPRRHCVWCIDVNPLEKKKKQPFVIAGQLGQPGDRDGSHSLFGAPTGICADLNTLTLYVADSGMHKIKKLSLTFLGGSYESTVHTLRFAVRPTGGKGDEEEEPFVMETLEAPLMMVSHGS